ncbi:MAG: LysM peptidoglycan-binding domain-containing protein [Candidatus Omnitrophica bacterium]|nr:LysM peptidoglycan-binding domain-containing protein [Candidatus Omnitrophota bacterium]
MRHVVRITIGLATLALLSGCRTATKVTEVPRVDLQLEGGNRGYLLGTPPPPRELKTTRQIIHADVEIPSLYKPTHGNTAATLESGEPSEGATGETGTEVSSSEPTGTYDIYTVKPGESLWTIAAQPDVYGKATRWRRIYDANRDQLKSPNHVRAGMKLKIPRGGSASTSSDSSNDEGTAFKK